MQYPEISIPGDKLVNAGRLILYDLQVVWLQNLCCWGTATRICRLWRVDHWRCSWNGTLLQLILHRNLIPSKQNWLFRCMLQLLSNLHQEMHLTETLAIWWRIEKMLKQIAAQIRSTTFWRILYCQFAVACYLSLACIKSLVCQLSSAARS